MAKTTRTVTITVGREGAVSTDFLHFSGAACMEAGQQLQRVLAEFGLVTRITTFTPKPELFQPSAAQVGEQQETHQAQEGGN